MATYISEGLRKKMDAAFERMVSDMSITKILYGELGEHLLGERKVGDTIRFRRYKPFTVDTAPLVEEEVPMAAALSWRTHPTSIIVDHPEPKPTPEEDPIPDFSYLSRPYVKRSSPF